MLAILSAHTSTAPMQLDNCTTTMISSVVRSLTLLLTAASPQHHTSHPLLPPTTRRRTARCPSGTVCSQTGPMLMATPRSRPQAHVSCSTLSASSMAPVSLHKTTATFTLPHAPICRRTPRTHQSLNQVKLQFKPQLQGLRKTKLCVRFSPPPSLQA